MVYRRLVKAVVGPPRRTFQDPISYENYDVRHGLVFNKQMYHPQHLHDWVQHRDVLPHNPGRKFTRYEKDLIKNAADILARNNNHYGMQMRVIRKYQALHAKQKNLPHAERYRLRKLIDAKYGPGTYKNTMYDENMNRGLREYKSWFDDSRQHAEFRAKLAAKGVHVLPNISYMFH